MEIILDDVKPWDVFRTCNGVYIRNIYELLRYVESCDEYDFRYHVNPAREKDDFADWIRETVRDEELANDLEGEFDREDYAKKIRRRLDSLASN